MLKQNDKMENTIKQVKGSRIGLKYGWVLEKGTLTFMKQGAYKGYINTMKYDPNRKHGQVKDKFHPLYKTIKEYI